MTDAAPRYRCTACGNLTRFNVTRSQRTRSFHHYTVGGALTVEQAVVLDDRVDEVACCWCDSSRAVEEVVDGVAPAREG